MSGITLHGTSKIPSMKRRHSDSEIGKNKSDSYSCFLTRQVSPVVILSPRESLATILEKASQNPITTAKTVNAIFQNIQQLFFLQSVVPLQASSFTENKDISYLQTIVTTLHSIQNTLTSYPGRACYLPQHLHFSAELLSTNPINTKQLAESHCGIVRVITYEGDHTMIQKNTKQTHTNDLQNEIHTYCSLPPSPYIASFAAVTKKRSKTSLITEYLPEGDLWAACNEDPKKNLTPTNYLSIARCITKGLLHMHEHNLIYQDMKPENVVLIKIDDGYGAKLIDFGLTCSNPSPILKDSKGTPAYFPPEYYQGKVADCYCFNVQPSHATDVWSLGATLVEMILGGQQLIYMLNPTPELWNAATDGNTRCMQKSFTDKKLQEKIDALLTKKLASYHPSPEITTFINFLRDCLQVDPAKRRTAQQLVTQYFSS